MLLVDDDEDTRCLVDFVLTGAGFQVLTAPDGRQALGLLEAASDVPALVIVDLRMPVMSGIEFLDALSKDERLCKIPVVVMSAADGKPDHPLVVQHLPKPFDPAQLVRIVKATAA